MPTPDAVGSISMSATAGKVALVRTAGLLSGACPSGADLADLIGFGAASCAETSPTAQLSNTTAALRLQGGTTDTDDNSADFVILGPTPRNSAVITTAPAADVVISQVYGGGGNSGAELKNDFIELRNRELFDISVAGWTVQYTSAAGSAWAATALNGTIPAGGYYLVQEAAGSGGSLSLPAPDAAGNIAMSATSGKVALVAGATPLTGTCPRLGRARLRRVRGRELLRGLRPYANAVEYDGCHPPRWWARRYQRQRRRLPGRRPVAEVHGGSAPDGNRCGRTCLDRERYLDAPDSEGHSGRVSAGARCCGERSTSPPSAAAHKRFSTTARTAT